MDNSKSFREELAIQYPTLGRALWGPDPGGHNPVQVGDVDFIRHTYFYCLFKALLPRDAPIRSFVRIGPSLPALSSETGTQGIESYAREHGLPQRFSLEERHKCVSRD